MYKDTLKQLMSDVEDFLEDVQGDQSIAGDAKAEIFEALDEALYQMEYAIKQL